MDVLFNKLTPAQQRVLLEGPALQPPLGVKSDFAHRTDRNGEGYAAVTICITISTLVFALRMYAKGFVSRRFAVEDCKSKYPFIIVLGLLLTRP